MARYTTLVRDVCEYYAGVDSTDKGGINAVLDGSWDKIFTKNWEIFDESYRKPLCEKILRKYFTREICAETVGLWKLWVDATLCEIMPTYNQLYETTLIKYDIFNNMELNTYFEKHCTTDSESHENGNTHEDGTITNSGKSTTNTTDTSTNKSESDTTDWKLHSDTPQGDIADLDTGNYLSDATKNTNNTSVTQSVSDKGTITGSTSGTTENLANGSSTTERKGNEITSEDWKQIMTGKNSGNSNASLLKEFRENILNIDQMIIKDLEPLFFQLW